jgi:hypothetical protein
MHISLVQSEHHKQGEMPVFYHKMPVFYLGTHFFRIRIVTMPPRERRRIKIPAFGGKMRRTSQDSLAVGGLFLFGVHPPERNALHRAV